MLVLLRLLERRVTRTQFSSQRLALVLGCGQIRLQPSLAQDCGGSLNPQLQQLGLRALHRLALSSQCGLQRWHLLTCNDQRV